MFEPGGLPARIARLFAEHLHIEVPSAEADLFETGALDSMAFVELLAQLEREFGIAIALDDIDMEAFRTIGAIASFVESRQRERAVHWGEAT